MSKTVKISVYRSIWTSSTVVLTWGRFAGGLSWCEVQSLIKTLHDTRRLMSLGIMETNPILDTSNRTDQVAVSLTASLFGKRII